MSFMHCCNWPGGASCQGVKIYHKCYWMWDINRAEGSNPTLSGWSYNLERVNVQGRAATSSLWVFTQGLGVCLGQRGGNPCPVQLLTRTV